MEISNRIVYLLKQRIGQTLDDAGQAELAAWADSHPAYRQLLEEVADEAALKAALLDFHRVYGADEAASIRRMEQRIEAGIGQQQPVYNTRKLSRWLPYAAAVLLVVSIVGWWAIGIRPSAVSIAVTDIQPGGNKATLTLADGRVIDLSSEQEGIVVGAEDITYQDGSTLGAIIPRAAEESLPNPGDASVLLSLTTPKGGTYQVTLPDGSRVWLNSASTLKYPSRFSANHRIVEIDGEGYFEIEKDPKRPFKVRSSGQEVEVLGTAFNISAYAEDSKTKTTLVEGKVKVTSGTRTGLTTSDLRLSTKILSPGEQSITDESEITVDAVDTELYTAWKSGRFAFEGKSFEQVFNELARWYDIEIRYEGPVPDVEFYGGAFRNKNLGVVLRLLESAKLSYRMDGRTLIIDNRGEATPK